MILTYSNQVSKPERFNCQITDLRLAKLEAPSIKLINSLNILKYVNQR